MLLLRLLSPRIATESLSLLTSLMMTVFRSMSLTAKTQDFGQASSSKEAAINPGKVMSSSLKTSSWVKTLRSTATSSTSPTVMISLRNGTLRTQYGKDSDSNNYILNPINSIYQKAYKQALKFLSSKA